MQRVTKQLGERQYRARSIGLTKQRATRFEQGVGVKAE